MPTYSLNCPSTYLLSSACICLLPASRYFRYTQWRDLFSVPYTVQMTTCDQREISYLTGRLTDGQKNGRTDRRINWRSDWRTEGRTAGRTEMRTDARTDGRTDWQTGGRTEVRTDERTDGLSDGRTDGRTDVWKNADWCAYGRASRCRVIRSGHADKGKTRTGIQTERHKGGRADGQAFGRAWRRISMQSWKGTDGGWPRRLLEMRHSWVNNWCKQDGTTSRMSGRSCKGSRGKVLSCQ